ncbi:MAG: hypothetical protein ABJF01_26525 [bacterium]
MNAEASVFTDDAVTVVRASRLSDEVAGYVFVASNLAQVHPSEVRTAEVWAGILGATLLLLLLLSVPLQAVISRPILDLARTAREVAGTKNYALRATNAGRHDAGRTPLIIGDLRNAPISFVPLPKLDVAGSSPVARSLEVVGNW